MLIRMVKNVFRGAVLGQRNSIRLQSTSINIDKVSLDNPNKFVSVAWKNESDEGRIPFLWLRDNCRCNECFDSTAQQRLLLMSDFDLDSTPKSVNRENDGSEISVIWQDGHRSQFTAEWLKRQFSPTESDVAKLAPRLWGSELEIPRFDFEKVLSDDKVFYDWMEDLQVTGLTLLYNVPKKPGQVQRIGSRVSFLKITHHGSCFLVNVQPGAHNTAYTAGKLGFHTDLPHHTYMPGVQLLHCIEQAKGKGGGNQFTDGFNIAKLLKEEKPDIYYTLTTVPINFFDVGKVDGHGYYFYKNSLPTISLDEDGNPSLISYNNGVRGLNMRVPPNQIHQVYFSLKKFNDYLYDPRNLFNYKMSAGEMVVFNNRRLLHGRSAYTLTQSDGGRCLEGCYIDWDQVWSRMRSIKRKLEMQ